MVVHGIPGKFKLTRGDIISVDIGVVKDGWVADAARTFPVGEVGAGRAEAARGHRGRAVRGRRAVPRRQPPRRRLARRPGARRVPTASRSSSRWSATASAATCTRSRRSPTTAPPGKGILLEEGMVLAVEPMVNAGRHMVRMGDDGWAIYSQDGSLAAHFEFTIAITAAGPRILTPLAPPRSAARRRGLTRPRTRGQGRQVSARSSEPWPRASSRLRSRPRARTERRAQTTARLERPTARGPGMPEPATEAAGYRSASAWTRTGSRIGGPGGRRAEREAAWRADDRGRLSARLRTRTEPFAILLCRARSREASACDRSGGMVAAAAPAARATPSGSSAERDHEGTTVGQADV